MNKKQRFGLMAAVFGGLLITSYVVNSQPVSASQRWEYATVTGWHNGEVEFAKPGISELVKAPAEIRKSFTWPATALANWGANKLASEGWEAVSMAQGTTDHCHILLRRAK